MSLAKPIIQESLQELFEEAVQPPIDSKAGVYNGPDLEAGGTSIAGREVAALKSIVEPMLKEGMTIIDYGAGKFARNADYLRKKGFRVYAYDPFNGKANSGWEIGEVSNKKPTEKFDLGFSSFVLNVVKDSVETSIIKDVEALAKTSVHIVRNDIIPALKKGLAGKSKAVIAKFAKQYYKDADVLAALDSGEELTAEQIADFSVFGFATSKGFQRLPMLERKGYSLKKKSSGWKVYVKG